MSIIFGFFRLDNEYPIRDMCNLRLFCHNIHYGVMMDGGYRVFAMRERVYIGPDKLPVVKTPLHVYYKNKVFSMNRPVADSV